MFSWFKRQHWKLVKTFHNNVIHIDRDKKETNQIVYYHLFESDEGKRKVKYDISYFYSSPVPLKTMAQRYKIYQEKIYRWEEGRLDPDIPTYDQIPEEDTANVLKGKI